MKSSGISLISFSDVIEMGAKNQQPQHLPNRDDTYIICYTSGTTGTPKGVIITHRNILANISGWAYMIDKLEPEILDNKSLIISYLPLSHMMEQVTHWTTIMYGARIGYFSGSIQRLTEDIKALRPTAFPVVPRLLNRLYGAIQSKVQNGNFLVRMIYNIAYAKKLDLLKQGITTKESFWDKLVFNRIQEQLGGQVQIMATGSAPISEEVLQTCRIALGATIVEGKKGQEVVQIMVRGPSVTKGYYKDPEKTAELFDEQGFVHTGDVGELLPNGTIRIIDRKKHIFKLAQGEYVAPEKIENVYIRSPVLQQVYVDGNSLERWLIAVVVPEPKVLENWNEENGVKGRSLKEICADEKAQEYVLSQLHHIGKENKLNSIEQVKRVYLEVEPFTVENDLLTPTLKAKRPQLRQKYKEIMSRIYEENRNL
ncbi:AMP-binding enzyme [Ancylostoma caninum]|uniref:long-chain-fatty-acid--CoA ligase n=1 Tax=Ancylostoma caninum TaxID=29170 RepID=A0A368G4D6_ANCCA|nr:AMP-binding enzyme [Ancylostoma caninum]